MAPRKRLQNDRAFLRKEWDWDSAVRRHCSLEHCCVSTSVSRPWERFWATNVILLGEWLRSSPAFWRASFACFSFFVFSCPIIGLQRSIVKLKVVEPRFSCMTTSWRSLKEGPIKLLTRRFCSKLSSVKCSAQTCECFEGVKHSLFIFISPSLLSFGPWVNLKVPTLDFQWLFQWSSMWTWNQNGFKFPAFLELTNSDVTSFISEQLSDSFPNRFMTMKG